MPEVSRQSERLQPRSKPAHGRARPHSAAAGCRSYGMGRLYTRGMKSIYVQSSRLLSVSRHLPILAHIPPDNTTLVPRIPGRGAV